MVDGSDDHECLVPYGATFQQLNGRTAGVEFGLDGTLWVGRGEFKGKYALGCDVTSLIEKSWRLKCGGFATMWQDDIHPPLCGILHKFEQSVMDLAQVQNTSQG